MSTSTTELRAALRRLEPERRLPIARRPDSDLPFLAGRVTPGTRVMLDTTVYIDQLQGRLPAPISQDLRRAAVWHSIVAMGELLHGLGRVDAARADYPAIRAQILGVVADMPPRRLLAPDTETWRDAALADGLLTRLRGGRRAEHRATLNDALILLTGRKHGLPVLTRNLADFDALQQLRPDAQVLFYRT
jgi:predicted nucleic acid-binding protein